MMMLRHLLQVERIVGDDTQFGARDGGPLGMAAGGDDDLFRGDALAADIQRVRIDEGGARVEDRRAGVVQQPAVDALQPGDFAILGGDQLGPVMRRPS